LLLREFQSVFAAVGTPVILLVLLLAVVVILLECRCNKLLLVTVKPKVKFIKTIQSNI
jgi:hypothetical protein